MKLLRLYIKTYFGVAALFLLVAFTTSFVCIRAVDTQVSQEYESNSKGLAKSIADASVDILLNRDLSSLQSLIDQYVDIQGISYIYITDENSEFLAHTFVPYVPDEVLNGIEEIKNSDPSKPVFFERHLSGIGDFLEVSFPILRSEAGRVQVLMDQSNVSLKIQAAVGQQVYAMVVIFFGGLFLVLLLVYLAAKPIRQLLQYAVNLARGEKTDDPKNQALLERKDEYGDLARLFDYFATIRDPEKTGQTPIKEPS